MKQFINVDEKKDFINYLLNRYYFKRRESIWILNYLLTTEDLLERTHFVKEVEKCPIGLLISTSDSKETSICLFRENIKILDGDNIFYFIRYLDGELFIEVSFPEDEMDSKFLSVLEENPYAIDFSKEDSLLAEKFLNHCLDKQKLNYLHDEINKALDEKNEKKFFKLTKEYNELKEKMNQ